MASLFCQRSQVREEPEERVTPVAMDTGPEHASSSSTAADMEMQLPRTDKRAVGKVEDSEMDDVRNESKRAKTVGGMEVCVLDDNCDEWR